MEVVKWLTLFVRSLNPLIFQDFNRSVSDPSYSDLNR